MSIKSLFKNRKWKRGELIKFFERLYIYSSAHIPLVKAIRLSVSGKNQIYIEHIEQICISVESGKSLSSSIRLYLKPPNHIISFIEQGELSGNMPEAFNLVREMLEREDELYKKIISSIIYPLLIAVCTGLLTLGLVRGVMPQIIPLLQSLNTELPLLTRVVISSSNIIIQYGLWILLGSIIIVITVFFVNKRYYRIKRIFQIFIMRIPIVGKLYILYCISIFLRSFGSLLKSGITTPNAYRISVEHIQLQNVRAILTSMISRLESGIALSQIITLKIIPEHVYSLVRAGESSGTLSESLIRSANIIDRDIDSLLKKFTVLLEPMLMVLMGIIVGAIALSIMIPIYDISKVIQQTR